MDLTILLCQFNKLLICNNYNTIENIFMTFSKKSLNKEEYEKNKSEIFSMNDEYVINNDNFLNYFLLKELLNL